MPGPGGGPSRRSHTKSRKGCKTCKRRHIRCDESFPQCKNCTKHQVRCDYHDNVSSPEENLRISTGGNLPWTPEIERAVDSWRQSGQFPFPNLPIHPPLQVKSLPRNEVRLLYHVCSGLDSVTSNRTAKLSLWTDLMPKFLGLASTSNCLMQAILAFSAAILAWETNSEETRNVGVTYSGNAHAALQEAISNPDAMLAALILLSWVETDWDRWTRLTRTAYRIMAHIEQYPGDSVFTDFVSRQSVDFNESLNENTAYPLSESELRQQPSVYDEIELELTKMRSHFSSAELDEDWIIQFINYIAQILGANRPKSPKEQFNYLYHLRKLLLWVPVTILTSRNGDVQSLLILSHFYAVALRLEEAFPDVGAHYLGNLVLNPLEEIINVLQMYQSNPSYSSITQSSTLPLDFPQKAVNEYRSRRSWTSRMGGIQSTVQPSYGLSSISSELGNQFGNQYTYTPSLSPAFASPSPHLVSPPINSASTPRSPYLQVPGSGVDSYSYSSYTTSIAPYQTTPTTTYAGPSLLTSGFKPSSEDTYQITQADYTAAISTTPLSGSEADVMGSSPYASYGLSSSVASNGLGGYPGDIATGGISNQVDEQSQIILGKGKERSES